MKAACAVLVTGVLVSILTGFVILIYVSPLQYRPKLSDSSALKDSTKLEDVQKQLNSIFDEAKVKSQIIINHAMEIELSKLEGEKCKILQETWKEIIRLHMIMVVSMEIEEMKRRDTLKKITRDTQDSLKNYYHKITGFAWVLMITREANQALRE